MQESPAFHPSARVVRVCQLSALVGAVSLASGFFLAPQRTWANVLLAGNYLVGLALGAVVLLALLQVTGARWSEPLRRVPEALGWALPLAGLALLAVFLFQPSVYSWSSQGLAGEENASPLRSLWLDRPFFLARSLAYLGLWLVFFLAIIRVSRRQAQTPAPALNGKMAGLSAGFLVVFGITCWLASSDWIMSLEPDWFSTMFGVYNFAGLFVSALAAVTLVVILLGHFCCLGPFLDRDRLHVLGTLVFGFSSFWMYTWFCQYLLIWYTNHPEETVYLRRRWQGDWPALLFLDVGFNWAIPFVVLLFRETKRQPAILAAVCLIILAGRWVDLSLMIFPSQGDALAIPGPVEAGVALGSAGLLALAVLRSLGTAPVVPVQVAAPTEGTVSAQP
jgi:hypothetical protein